MERHAEYEAIVEDAWNVYSKLRIDLVNKKVHLFDVFGPESVWRLKSQALALAKETTNWKMMMGYYKIIKLPTNEANDLFDRLDTGTSDLDETELDKIIKQNMIAYVTEHL